MARVAAHASSEEDSPMPDREELVRGSDKRYVRRDARGRFTTDQVDEGLLADQGDVVRHAQHKTEQQRGTALVPRAVGRGPGLAAGMPRVRPVAGEVDIMKGAEVSRAHRAESQFAGALVDGLAEAGIAGLLARTAPAAQKGEWERYKTSHNFDGTYQNPQWLE